MCMAQCLSCGCKPLLTSDDAPQRFPRALRCTATAQLPTQHLRGSYSYGSVDGCGEKSGVSAMTYENVVQSTFEPRRTLLPYYPHCLLLGAEDSGGRFLVGGGFSSYKAAFKAFKWAYSWEHFSCARTSTGLQQRCTYRRRLYRTGA